MEKIFNHFKEQFKDKSLNEILHYAKLHRFYLSLVKDVDEYDNNEFAFVVMWHPNEEFNPTKRIVVECLYSHLTGDAEFTLLNGEVKKFGRTWKIVKDLDLEETADGCPIWWDAIKTEEGVLWINNYDGEMAFVEDNGRTLKTMI